MKKLMKTVAAAAVALVASSSFASLPSPTAGFEDLTADKYTVSEFVTKTDAGESVGSKYWYAITNASQDASAELATIVEGGAAIGCGNKYLSIDAQAPLYRTINDSSSSGGYGAALSADAEDIPASGIYLDTMVKFTVSSDEFKDGDLDTADKLAITCYSADDSNVTNMLVRAGYVSGQTITPTNYFLNLPDGFNADKWYRLTVRAIADTGSQFAPVGFAIYIDGELLEYGVAQEAGDDDYETAIANNSVIATYLYNQGKHAFFPSLVSAEYNAATTLSAVGFKGTGCLDNIAFLATKPDVLPDEGILVTIESLEGVSSVTVTVGQQTIEGDNGVYRLPTGTTAFNLDVDWDEDNGYTSGTIMQGESSISAGTVNVSDGTTITLKGNRNNFNLFDANGDAISGTFETIAQAMAATGVAKIQLAYDYTVAAADIPDGYIDIQQSITINLNGKTINGGESVSNPLFMVTDGNFVIIDSAGNGKVVYNGPGIVYGATAYIGATSGDFGPTFDGKLFFDAGEGYVIRGKFNAASNGTSEFLYADYLGDGDSIESTCSATPVDGYWVVAPSAQPEPTKIDVPTAASNLVYDGEEQTGVEAGTGYTLSGDFKATNADEYTATATLEDGYIWSDDTTEAKDINWSIAAKTDADVVVTLTSQIAEYTTQLAFPTASATIGNGVVEGTPTWNPAEITEPNAGETNTYTVTFTVTTANYAGSTGTAEFKVWKAAGGGGGDWPADPTEVSGQTAADAFGIIGDLATADAGVLATWAKAKGVDYSDRTTEILTDAFLLDCANTQEAIDEAKANFKVTSITVVGDTVTITPADAADYGNGQIVIEGAAAITSPMSWHTKTTGDHFFRATLVVKPVTP